MTGAQVAFIVIFVLVAVFIATVIFAALVIPSEPVNMQLPTLTRLRVLL